ncbi:S-layer homology domain-containing protein [Ornithinibacillus californiensis]|uniref:S-layer homology domain-containing protein n=1 Tax=Ornithinibacillus californiensis TaxID=161536 RepID=UPI00069D4961|nr:glycosyl hydrolase family 18 protein [Ornithinibacillus californiensis]
MNIINYRLQETDDGYEVYIYLDPGLEEFSQELGTKPEEQERNIKKMVEQFVKKQLKGAKVTTVKVLVGTTLLTSIVFPTGQADAHDADFNMSYLYFGNTQQQLNAVAQTNGNLDVISPSYFNLNDDGSLYLTPMLDPTFIDEMHKQGIKVVPFVSNHWDRAEGRAALQNREELSDQIAEAIIQYNLDGVNIDIENVTEIDRDNYTDFVRLLREKIPKDKEISVAIAANPNQWSKGWHGSYDNKELAKYADYLMVMAYDEHYQGGEPGPVASIGWVEKSIQTLINVEGVAPEKIVLGLPFFGRYWNHAESTGGRGASMHQVETLVAKYNGTITFDQASLSPKATFTITSGDPITKISGRTLLPGTYEVWFENNESIHAKMDLVHKYGLKGTGSWSLGQEDPDIWDDFSTWQVHHAAHDFIMINNDNFPFTDARNHWTRNEILYTYQKGWFQGNERSQFNPNDGLTRAQAAALFVKVFNLNPLEPIGNSSFTDVKDSHWAKEPIEIAVQHGVFKGKEDGTFDPNEVLTRQQMAAIFDNTLKDIYDTTKMNEPVSFKDVSKSSSFHNAIVNVRQQGIIMGSGENFRPGDEVTRAQMAVILTNAADYVAKKNGETLFPRTLRLKDEGADVTLLQIYLNRAGISNAYATGIFNSKTEILVQQFQSDNQLTVDGMAGPNTINKLKEKLP